MPGLGDIIVDDINKFSDAVGSWTAILLVLCLGGVLLAVRLNIERIHDHNRGRLATFKTAPKFKQWLRVYLAAAHGCDARILDPVWLFDEGWHGETMGTLYDNLIADVCRFLKARDFWILDDMLSTGWKMRHFDWRIGHKDGRSVHISAESLTGLGDYPVFKMAMQDPTDPWHKRWMTFRNMDPRPESFHRFRKRIFGELQIIIVEKQWPYMFNDPDPD